MQHCTMDRTPLPVKKWIFPPRDSRAGPSRKRHSFPLVAFRGLPKCWLYPVAIIQQVGRRPRLIFDFTWSGLNEATTRDAPEEVMRFGVTLHRIIQRFLMAYPRISLVYLGRVDLGAP